MNDKQELEILGDKFRSVRLSKNLTQNELAALVDKDQQSIQRFEKGKINPSYLYLLEICEGLEVELIDVLNTELED
jgi:transcriptional regulator with XRE-family HTH domain